MRSRGSHSAASSQWKIRASGSHIVVIKKKSEKFCICTNFKMTDNPELHIDFSSVMVSHFLKLILLEQISCLGESSYLIISTPLKLHIQKHWDTWVLWIKYSRSSWGSISAPQDDVSCLTGEGVVTRIPAGNSPILCGIYSVHYNTSTLLWYSWALYVYYSWMVWHWPGSCKVPC